MKKYFSSVFVMTIALIALFFSAYALDDNIGEELRLYVGETSIISVNNPKRIVIGNPSVADVTDVTRNEVTVVPKNSGTTTLVIWDNFGEQTYQVKVFSENILEIKRRIDNLLAQVNLPGVYAQAAEDEGKVLLLGQVKTPQERERLDAAIGSLKAKVVDLILVKEDESVVDIDVQVLELNKDASTALGFSNVLASDNGYSLTEMGSPGIADVAGLNAGTKFSTLFKLLNLQRSAAYSWTLYALVEEGKARILSRPRLSCQSGKEAELLVGGEKPIFATFITEAAATGATVEYKEYGIKLKIKPTVTEEGRIKLALNVEVSDIEAPESLGTWARAYPLKKRTASTQLYINDGQTLAIGGLMRQKEEEDISKTPGLGDIPILGMFFRKKTTKIGGGGGERGNTELFIAITPTIVRDAEAPLKVSRQQIKSNLAVEGTSSTSAMMLQPEDVQNYSNIVQRRILDSLRYPYAAKDAGFQGVVKLSLHISYAGELLDVAVKSSSGYKVLDDNAISVARKVTPYPPFPPTIDQQDLWIEIPIVYRLD